MRRRHAARWSILPATVPRPAVPRRTPPRPAANRLAANRRTPLRLAANRPGAKRPGAKRPGVTCLGAVCLAGLLVGVPAAPPAAADNLTASGNRARTGWDSAEPGLAPAEVTAGDFGQQFDTRVDGSVYAQPLVIGDTVVITTERARAYGLDASTGAVRWSRSFGAPFQAGTIGCGDLTPDLGQTSTGVYDPAADLVYLTTKIADGPTPRQPHWYLHAVRPSDGTEPAGFPVILQGTADNDPTVTFDPYLQLQRTGLLLANGTVYLGFGAHCDIGGYRGWVIAVQVAGGPPLVRSVWTSEASTGGGAGIWHAGGGLMSDGNDANGRARIFLATGNGLSPPVGPGRRPPGFLGDAVVRIGLDASGHLTARDFFAPHDVAALAQDDKDLGAGGPVALPDSFGTARHPHLLVEDGKDGRIFLLDRDHLGGRQQGPGGTDAAVQVLGPFRGVWGHPAVYPGEGGWVYYVENSGPMRAYARSVTTAGDPALSAVGASMETFGYTSGSPVVTSDGTRPGSALVWTIYSTGGGGTGAQLRAYDAVPSGGTLRLRWSAPIGVTSKFALPATSRGRVYVGTRDGHVRAFGRPASALLSGRPVDFGLVPVGAGAELTARLTAGGPVTITGVAASGAGFGADPTGLPVTLAAGEVLAIPVRYDPVAAGPVTGTLTVTTDRGRALADLHGVGAAPGLAAAPTTLDFGPTPTTTAPTRTVVVSNSGTQPETVLAVTGPAAPFTATGLPPVGTVIPPQQSVAITVGYRPVLPAVDSGQLAVTSTRSTLVVPLAGVAQAGRGRLSLLPPRLDFGDTVLGSARTLSFDLANTGNVPVTITKAKAPAGAFGTANPMSEGITIGPEDTLHQDVTFAPTDRGTASGRYEITTDDGRGVQAVTLTGAGVPGVPLPAPTGTGWARTGSAAARGTDLVLTAARADQTGSAFARTTVPSDGLTARFTAEISGGTGADGLTFTLLPASAPATSLGRPGSSLGFGGLPGAVAVTLDTFQNSTDPGPNFVAVATGRRAPSDALVYAATSTDLGPLRTGSHQVTVNVYNGHLRVTVDGDLKIDAAVPLPADVRPGFTAATGGRTQRHVVRDVLISTPG